MEKIKNIKSPFMCYCAKVIPLAFDESMSYYETLCNFYNYLKNEVMPVINNNAEALNQLQIMVIELKEYIDNYFDNLDIQTEINNKLDEMADSGELESIIAQYMGLNSLKVYDTLDDLIDAENLSNGSVVETLGYNQIGDNGGCKYLIRTKELSDSADGYTLIDLTNLPTLIAEIIIPEVLNAHQFGIFGDDETDNTDRLNKALYYNLYIPSGTYIVSDRLAINNHLVYGDGVKQTIIKLGDSSTFDNDAILKTSNGVDGFTIKDLSYDGNKENNSEYKNFLTLYNSNNIVIENIEVKDSKGGGIKLNDSINVEVINCNFKDLDGIEGSTSPAIYGNPVNNLTIENCRCDDIADHFLYLTCDDENKYSKNVIVKNCVLKGCGKDALTAGSAICVYANSRDIIIDNCILKDNRSGINASYHGAYTMTPKNITINNCIIDGVTLSAISVTGLISDTVNNVKISNCEIKNSSQDGIATMYAKNITINNTNVTGCTRNGIASEYDKYINIYNSVIVDNTTGCIIGNRAHESDDIHIYDTLIYGIDGQTNGLYLNVCDNVKIYQCDIYDNTSDIIENSATNVSYINMLDRSTTNENLPSLTYSNRIPLSNAYKEGDTIFYNTNVGSKRGAICTVAGSPGTWREF